MRSSIFPILRSISAVLAASALLITSCNRLDKNHYQSEADKIAAKFVPDRRTGICNLRVRIVDRQTAVLTGETTEPAVKEEISKTLGDSFKNLYDSILILPDTTTDKVFRGLVTLSVANLRREPQQSAELVSQAILGTPLEILKKEGGWLLVRTPDRYISWVENSSIKLLTERELKVWNSTQRVIFKENIGWITSGPGESDIISDLVAGCILQKGGESGEYTNVILPDGRQGFVKSDKMTGFNEWKQNITCTGEGLCKKAESLMGIPYLWGGTSTKGVDCSGFVQTVFFNNGLILQRDASLQAIHGEPVDISRGYGNLEIGDLLFFGPVRDGVPHVTHVAIYKGDSEYIHSSGRVMVNSLDSTRTNYSGARKKALLGVRRIIGVNGDAGIVAVKDHKWY